MPASAEIMLSLQTLSVIPTVVKENKIWIDQASQRLQQRRNAVKRSSDEAAKTLSMLHIGQYVFFHTPKKESGTKKGFLLFHFFEIAILHFQDRNWHRSAMQTFLNIH